MFTQKCFINKNTIEIKRLLKALGYDINPFYVSHNYWDYEDDVLTNFDYIPEEEGIEVNFDSYEAFEAYENNKFNEEDWGEGIDCGVNEDLFFALSAMNDENSYMQYYKCGGKMVLCEKSSWKKMKEILKNKFTDEELNKAKKATTEEIIKYFKTNGEK